MVASPPTGYGILMHGRGSETNPTITIGHTAYGILLDAANGIAVGLPSVGPAGYGSVNAINYLRNGITWPPPLVEEIADEFERAAPGDLLLLGKDEDGKMTARRIDVIDEDGRQVLCLAAPATAGAGAE